MSKPFFSVIVPAHNSAEFIEKGLHSIKYQSFKDYEMIVVCDNCTDNTANIALNYADKTLIRDYGLDGLARNAGIEAAEGDWLLFMDHDDWWLHEYVFEMLAENAGKHGEDILMYSFIWKGIGYTKNFLNCPWSQVWNKCWRRSAVGETRFSDREYASDSDFHREMMEKRLPMYAWDMPMYYYNYMQIGSQSYNREKGTG